MNITLLSLCLSSLITMSPLHIINSNYQEKVSTTILNSHFSFSFTNIVFSNTKYHHTLLKNNEFSHSLKSAIYFSNEGEVDDKQTKLTIIKNKEFDNEHKEYKDVSKYGDLTIATCTFKNCNSENGGALFIEQDCSVILHESIFDSCSATYDGAGGYICKQKNERTDNEITDDQLKKVDIQYCCFQKCSVVNKDNLKTGFGSALLLAGQKVKLFYASTVDCPGNGEEIEEARGAQFDIQSTDVSSENVNATGGKSYYCGSIEYRQSNTGSFKFQTIMNMKCRFVTSFSKFESDSVQISYCNLLNNDIAIESGDGTYSALIHVRQQSITVKNFVFMNNNFGDNGRIASKQSQNPDIYPDVTISLINCYADSYTPKESEAFTTQDCDFNKGKQLTLNEISQLDLGECKGNVTPSELVITKKFTPSFEFSESDGFSESQKFEKTSEFSESQKFTKSYEFTRSSGFSKSYEFSESLSFTSAAVVPNENKEGDKLKPGEIAGIAVGCVAAAAIVAGVVVFFIRKHRMNLPEQEDMETIDSSQPTTNTDNPIYNKNAADDPFKEDF